MPGNKKGGNQNNKQNQKGGDDFKFEFGGNGKPELNKETQAAIMPVLQQRLDKLIGVDSGYLDTLPQSVQKRIKALKKLQSDHDALEEQFRKEMEAIEKKYDGLKHPLYSRRSEIVNGKSEPTAEELAGAEDAKKDEAKTESKEDDIKGIPEFWLTALKHHPDVEQMIQPHDEPILKHLTDIKVSFPDKECAETFCLTFEFSANEYFKNSVLTKTFNMESVPEGTTLKDIVSSEIEWKEGKNVTVKKVQKRQGGGGGKRGGRGGRGGKGGNAGKVVTVEEDVESFFHFFDNIDLEEFDDPEAAEDMLESDFDLGTLFQSEIIAEAVKWFTGEAAIEGMGDDDEDDEDDDDEDEDDQGDVPAIKGKGRKSVAEQLNEDYKSDEDAEYDPKTDPNAAQQPECKQQ